jgi:cytochrome c553
MTMASLKKIIGFGAGAIAALVVGLFGLSESRLNATPARASTHLVLPSDEASLAEGKRLMITRGCLGCHGEGAEGQVFMDEPWVAYLPAPNLTRILRRYPVDTIVAAMRQGIGVDGRALLAMPSEMLQHLTDADTAKIIAYLKTLPEASDTLGSRSVGPLGRFGLITGEFRTAPAYVAATGPLRYSAGAEPVVALGEYTAMTVCSECHGTDLKGYNEPDFTTPDLAIAASYGFEDFAHFMQTGEAAGGRELPLMSEVARARFAHLTAAEVSALYTFLVARADAMMEGGGS